LVPHEAGRAAAAAHTPTRRVGAARRGRAHRDRGGGVAHHRRRRAVLRFRGRRTSRSVNLTQRSRAAGWATVPVALCGETCARPTAGECSDDNWRTIDASCACPGHPLGGPWPGRSCCNTDLGLCLGKVECAASRADGAIGAVAPPNTSSARGRWSAQGLSHTPTSGFALGR
jgi:hypothetical protein